MDSYRRNSLSGVIGNAGGEIMTDPEQYVSFEFDDLGVAVFNRRCPKCGRWLAFKNVLECTTGGDSQTTALASCKRCGKVELEFEGWFSKEECTP